MVVLMQWTKKLIRIQVFSLFLHKNHRMMYHSGCVYMLSEQWKKSSNSFMWDIICRQWWLVGWTEKFKTLFEADKYIMNSFCSTHPWIQFLAAHSSWHLAISICYCNKRSASSIDIFISSEAEIRPKLKKLLKQPWNWKWLTKICIASKIHPEWFEKWILQVISFHTEKQCLVLRISSSRLVWTVLKGEQYLATTKAILGWISLSPQASGGLTGCLEQKHMLRAPCIFTEVTKNRSNIPLCYLM